MAEEEKPAPTPILRELLTDLERQLVTYGYGIVSQTSTRDVDGEIVSIIIQDKRTTQIFRYDFAYRSCSDQVPWIESLGRRLLATRASAIYAVSSLRFSKEAQLNARRVSISLHEVREVGKNRILLFDFHIEGASGERPPWLLTQRLRGRPLRALWFGRGVLDADGTPTLEFLVWVADESPDKMHFYTRTRRLSPTAPHLQMQLFGKCALPQVQKCYARHLGHCDKRSSEHIISDAILRLFPARLQVCGWPGLPEGRTVELSRANLVSNVLCKHHNELLSKVDGEALPFFTTLHDALIGQAVIANTEIDGMWIERWLLKIACGMAAASERKGIIAATPAEWVDILFGKAAWPRYFCSFWKPKQIENAGAIGIEVATYFDGITGRLMSLELRMMQLSMTLVLGPFPAPSGLRRPPSFQVTNGQKSLAIAIRWPSEEADVPPVTTP